MKRLASLFLLGLIAVTLQAGVPTNLRIKAVLTPSGTVNTKYRDGNDGTAALPIGWAAIPTQAGVQGTPRAVNLRSLYLTEPGSPNATLTTDCTPTLGGGWTTSADGLAYTYSGAYSGICRTTATRSAAIVISAAYTVTSVANAGSDTAAPTQVIGVVATQTAAGIHLVWYPASEPRVASQTESGLKEYRIYKDGSGTALATVTAPDAGIPIQLTGVELGGSVGGSKSQTVNNYSLISAGDGIGGTEESGYFAYQSISGDFRLCADLHDITGETSANAQVALMVRDSLTANDKTVFTRANTTSLRTRGRGTAGAATVTYGNSITQAPPSTVCVIRAGSTWTTNYSVNGNAFTNIDTSMPIVLSDTVLAGIFGGTGGGSTITADVRNLTLTKHSPLSYDDIVTDGASHAYVIKAVDNSINIGTGSASVSATAPATADVTAPGVPTGLTGSGPSQNLLSWTWVAPTDVSGIRGCQPAIATTSGGTYTNQTEQVASTFNYSTGITASTTRWLKVRCTDVAGNTGSFSSAVSATSAGAPGADSTPPTVPGGLSATGQNTTIIRITTSGSTDVGGCGVAEYRLYRASSAAGPFNLVATFTGLTNDYNSGGPPNTTYFFKLTARDCASPQNESAQSATFSGTTTAAAGGTLVFQELWGTPYAFPNYPYGMPDYPQTWSSSSDNASVGGCNRSVSSGRFNVWHTPNTWQAAHCMIVYHGPVGGGKRHNFTANVDYLMGFRIRLEGTWTANTGAGAFDILFQMHGDNIEGHTANNPMGNLKAQGGVGTPWQWNFLGDTTSNKPYERNITYPLADGTGNCGNIVTNTDVDWVLLFKFGNPGYWKIYKNGVLCLNDVGINYFVGNDVGPYFSIGTYHGQPTGSTPQARRDIYVSQMRIGRVVDGIGYADVVPR